MTVTVTVTTVYDMTVSDTHTEEGCPKREEKFLPLQLDRHLGVDLPKNKKVTGMWFTDWADVVFCRRVSESLMRRLRL